MDKSVKLQNLVGEQLVGCGFNEILNNSLTAAAYYDGLETYKPENLVRLMNPLSNDPYFSVVWKASSTMPTVRMPT